MRFAVCGAFLFDGIPFFRRQRLHFASYVSQFDVRKSKSKIGQGNDTHKCGRSRSTNEDDVVMSLMNVCLQNFNALNDDHLRNEYKGKGQNTYADDDRSPN